MVLQRAPARAVLWGVADAGDVVTVALNGETWEVSVGSDSAWSIELSPQDTSPNNTITVSSTSGDQAELTNVAFGDVYLCSGQSNMEFTLNGAFNAEEEIADSINYPGLRLYSANKVESTVPLYDMSSRAPFTWGVSSPETVTGDGMWSYPSAVCYFFGRDLYTALDGAVPIGLVGSDWGGTKVRAWSPPEAIAQCSGNTDHHNNKTEHGDVLKTRDTLGNPNDATVLFNGMIAPILRTRFAGAIWYQGESDAGAPELYKCQFPAMISTWRAYMDQSLPFMFVQLAAYPDADYSYQREAQLSALDLPDVAFATAIDLGDPTSPEGDIHPRNKQEVARRLSLAARNLIYGQQLVSTGPVITGVVPLPDTSAAAGVTITLEGAASQGLTLNGTEACAACCTQSPIQLMVSGGQWTRAELQVNTQASTVTASLPSVPASVKVTGVRYAFEAYPQCALYNKQGIAAAPFRNEAL